MLTTEEYPEMNVGTGKFSDDVEMTVEYSITRQYRDLSNTTTLFSTVSVNSAQYRTDFKNVYVYVRTPGVQVRDPWFQIVSKSKNAPAF